MNNENRTNHLLWLLMEFHVSRYLMTNAEGRHDGAEKAERHLQLSYIYVASRTGTDIDMAPRISYQTEHDYEESLYKLIHDETAKQLTDYMDEIIGFPITGRPDYQTLAPKFFKEFIRISDEAYAEVEYRINEHNRYIVRHLL